MPSLRNILIVSTLATSVVMVACATSTGGSAEPPEPGATTTATATTADAELERLESLYRARADSALMEVHDADVAFMSGMIHHHAQALVMSALAPANGASPSVRTLTSRITNAQRDEIGLMQRWLRERSRPVPEVDEGGNISGMAGMAGMGGDHDMHMPGMLSPEQLDELRGAHGPEYDRLFLTYMIQHHNGAVTMVHELFAADGAAQDDFVFKLASDIQVDQTTEVARMQQMLDALSRPPNEPHSSRSISKEPLR